MTSSLLAMIWWHATKNKHLIDKNLHPFFIKGLMANLMSIPSFYNINSYFIC